MPYWLQFTIFAVIAGLMQYIVSYFTEKGKNLATKEDIKDITYKVESVKASYNESLERHKIELQKEFESYKYIAKLCYSLDKELITHISNLNQRLATQDISPETKEAILESATLLYNFISAYKTRYIYITEINNLHKCIKDIQYRKPSIPNEKLYPSEITHLKILSTGILEALLPPLTINKPEH
ncbi:hypothetical protein [Bacteroides graminisolvens]|uniref:hypothetical protein n=1 Tax=Bacteroides graminisolvens TaxID=477666 RepID=UPI0029C7F6F1|nr:hypothetical protein [Bacteroides graminisolvens]